MPSPSTALLVIDVQQAMFTATPPIYDADRLIDRVRLVLDKARAAGVPILFVRHDGGPGDEFETGTPGWHIHEALEAPGSTKVSSHEIIVEKRRADSFYETNLLAELKARGIEHLVIAGAQTDYCVDTTCRRARSLDFATTLVSDAHSTFDTDVLTARQIIDHHNRTLDGSFARLVTAEQLRF